MRKGLLQLVVEVDYDKIIKEGSIEALSEFTGKRSFDEIAEHHMRGISLRLEDAVRGLPHVKYEYHGELIPIQKEDVEVQEEPVSPPQDDEGIVDESLPEEGQEDSEDDENTEEPQASEVNYTEAINHAINHVSNDLGVTKSITVNSVVYESVKSELDEYNEDSVAGLYMGFPLHVEGMEEAFFISYKSYEDFSSQKFYYQENHKNK